MDNFPYEDILNKEHPTSRKHPRMTLHERAAQFAPFAALVGYDSCIDEEGRQTEPRRELDEERRANLDRKLQFLLAHLQNPIQADIEYFLPDSQKEGGCYQHATGEITRISLTDKTILLRTGEAIPLQDVWEIHLPADLVPGSREP